MKLKHLKPVALLSLIALSLAHDPSEAANTRPNLVFIMADDLGIGDVKCYGRDASRTETPHMDTLAAEGMRFTDAHTVASVCIPARMAIMTGRYPWRFRGTSPSGPWGFLNPRIPTGHFTLGRMLKRAGYRTGYVGKWHLGTLMQTLDGKNQGPDNVDYTKPLRIGPADYGFDYSFILPGSLDMYPYVFVRNGHFVGQVTARKGWSAFNRVGPAAEDFEDYKVLDTISREAEQFIARAAPAAREGEPFFLYFATTSPHTPTCPSPAFEGKSRLGLYGDFVMETDDCIGRVVQALRRHGVERNTLILVTSDHGAAAYAGNIRKAIPNNMRQLEKLGHYANSVYRGYKFSLYEGGLRVPLIARWPGVVPAGTQCDRVVGLVDLARTFADISGHPLAEDVAPDSVSFLPLLKDPNAKRARDSMIMRSTGNFAVREGRWKLALCPGSGTQGRWGNEPSAEAWEKALERFGRQPTERDLRGFPFVQLFDMKSDERERYNLAARHPDVVRRLVHLLDQQIASGRSTPGETLRNDVERVRIHARVPRFVGEKADR